MHESSNIILTEKNGTQKENIVYVLYIVIEQEKLTYCNKNQNSGCWVEGRWLIGKAHKLTLWGDANVWYLNKDIGYTIVHICKTNVQNTFAK